MHKIEDTMRIILATLLVFASCQTVPAPVAANVAFQRHAWEVAAENRRTVVLAYDKQLRRAYDQQLDAFFAKVATDSQPTTASAIALYKRVNARRRVIMETLDTMRAKFLDDSALEFGAKSAALTSEYLAAVEEGWGVVKDLAALAQPMGITIPTDTTDPDEAIP